MGCHRIEEFEPAGVVIPHLGDEQAESQVDARAHRGLGLGVIAVEVGQVRQADRQGHCQAVCRMHKNIARSRRFRSAAGRWRVVSASAVPLIRLCREQPAGAVIRTPRRG